MISSEAALRIQNLGLIEAITDRHNLLGLVSTHQQGKVPIDGIFISSSILITSGGYFPLVIAPSDYRALWVKLSISQAFGYVLYKIPPFSGRRVKCDNPEIANKFNTLYESYLSKFDLFNRIFNIQQAIEAGQ